MISYKCRMCGGELSLVEGTEICVCEYCGSRQVVPSLDDEKKRTLYERANKFLKAKEFDRAQKYFFNITVDYPDEADAFWSMLLCKFGIEYVEDPKTGKRIPTCHRSSFNSLFDDPDYKEVCRCASSYALPVHEEEAKRIEQLRLDIVKVASAEDPYDIFISFKETDKLGDRTVDSLLAEELYNTFTEKGYRVFYSRISLEAYVGQEYEPHIFAALNSAKVMLAVGSCRENYESTWVKNEWSRFLKLREKDREKAFIVCYKNMIVEDLPAEFKSVQAQDMNKVGAMQDLVRGISKMFEIKQKPVRKSDAASQLKEQIERMWLYINDSIWEKAEEYINILLSMDPHCSEAFLGKLCMEYNVTQKSAFASLDEDYHESENYENAVKYGDTELENYSKTIRYNKAKDIIKDPDISFRYYDKAYAIFKELGSFRDAEAMAEKCRSASLDDRYYSAVNQFEKMSEPKEMSRILSAFKELGNYKDSEKYYAECSEKLSEKRYQLAKKAYSDAKTPDEFINAANQFSLITSYKDSAKLKEQCIETANSKIYNEANGLLRKRRSPEEANRAASMFKKISGYRDSAKLADDAAKIANNMIEEKKYIDWYKYKYSTMTENKAPIPNSVELKEAREKYNNKSTGGVGCLWSLFALAFVISLFCFNSYLLCLGGVYIGIAIALVLGTILIITKDILASLIVSAICIFITYCGSGAFSNLAIEIGNKGILYLLAIVAGLFVIFYFFNFLNDKKLNKLKEKYMELQQKIQDAATAELDAAEKRFGGALDIEEDRKTIAQSIENYAAPKEDKNKK